jgi:hypothetical protein
MTTPETTNPPMLRRAASPVLRAVVTLGALVALGQAVLAGQLLTGGSGALMAHGIGGGIAVLLGLVQLVVAVVARVRGWATTAFAVLSGVLLLALVAQFFAGGTGAIGVHVPLGVLISGCYAALVVAVWRR